MARSRAVRAAGGPGRGQGATYTVETLRATQGENDWRDHTVLPLARLKGWTVYFTQRSTGSPAGFPDCWFVRNGVLLVRELKRDGEYPTRAQRQWLDALQAAGVDAGIWRPSDWLEIQEVLA